MAIRALRNNDSSTIFNFDGPCAVCIHVFLRSQPILRIGGSIQEALAGKEAHAAIALIKEDLLRTKLKQFLFRIVDGFIPAERAVGLESDRPCTSVVLVLLLVQGITILFVSVSDKEDIAFNQSRRIRHFLPSGLSGEEVKHERMLIRSKHPVHAIGDDWGRKIQNLIRFMVIDLETQAVTIRTFLVFLISKGNKAIDISARRAYQISR